MSAGSGLKVSLPNVITSQVLGQPAVHITVTADGTFMLNGRKLALGDVALFLKQLSGRRQTVVVDADKHAPLQAVISIFDAVRASGAGECVVAGLP
jgi:biopolymer transport protein ExbD